MSTNDQDSRITDRLPPKSPASHGGGDRVTERLPRAADKHPVDGRVTTRLEKKTAGPGLATESRPRRLVDGRFLVEDGPLGRETGEARVYRCRDLHTGETVAVKLYKAQVKPKEDVLASLVNLDHPGLVGLRSYGWWEERFFEVQEF